MTNWGWVFLISCRWFEKYPRRGNDRWKVCSILLRTLMKYSRPETIQFLNIFPNSSNKSKMVWKFKFLYRKFNQIMRVGTILEKRLGELYRVRERRSQSNGQAFSLYVELLVVTDHSIFEDHRRYTQTNDTDLIFLHMRTYFAHFVNEVLIHSIIKTWKKSISVIIQRLINVFKTRFWTILIWESQFGWRISYF